METGTHPHLLIIEDDVLLNDMTKRLLTQHGYCVTSAYSGSEALLLIEKGTFDLILLDLMLPGIPGETVLMITSQSHSTIKSCWCGLKQCSGAFRSLPPPTIAKYFALRTCPLIQKLWRLKSGIPPLL